MKLRKRIEEAVRQATGIDNIGADQALDIAQAVLLAVRLDTEENEPKAVVTIEHLNEADSFLAICLSDES
jgi:hypothetical protein